METGAIRDRANAPELTAVWLSAATLYFLLAASTIYLTSDGRTIATVWPANAVLVALLLLGRAPRWKTVLSAGLLGNLAANWMTRGSIAGPLLYSLANGVEIAIAVLLTRADGAQMKASGPTGKLFRFVAVAGLAAPLAGGLIGAATAEVFYAQPFASALTTWLFSDGLGLVVFTPVFLSIFNGELVDCFAIKTPAERAEALSLLALTALVTWWVFFVAKIPAVFMLYPSVMLVSFRVGSLGTKMAVMIVAAIGACATAGGSGPVTMMTSDPVAQAQMFQIALAVMMLTCLPVAVEVGERSRLASALRLREREASKQAATDALTGIFNRRGFEEAAEKMLSQPGEDLSLVAIDVDRFKGFNDHWGHQFGDQVLQRIASVLKAHTRSCDVLGRLGGDEFALLLCGDSDLAEAVCARIQAALRSTPISADAKTEVMIGISCGISSTRMGDRLQDIYRRADSGLYCAKLAGRNTVRSA